MRWVLLPAKTENDVMETIWSWMHESGGLCRSLPAGFSTYLLSPFVPQFPHIKLEKIILLKGAMRNKWVYVLDASHTVRRMINDNWTLAVATKLIANIPGKKNCGRENLWLSVNNNDD